VCICDAWGMRGSHLDKGVVFGDEMPSHGVQATPKDVARRQVDERLDAEEVQHQQVKHHHRHDVHHIGKDCTRRCQLLYKCSIFHTPPAPRVGLDAERDARVLQNQSPSS